MQLTHPEIRSLADLWLTQELSELEKHHALSGPISPQRIYEERETTSYLLSNAREALATSNGRSLDMPLKEFIELQGVDLESRGDSFELLRYEIMKREVIALQEQVKLLSGQPVTYPQQSISSSKKSSGSAKPSPKLSKLFEKYAVEQKTTGAWNRARSETEYRHALSVFFEVIEDVPANRVSIEMGREYKEQLFIYPNSRNKPKRRKEMSLEQLRAEPDYTSISACTASNQMIKVRGFFNWLLRNGYIDNNPLAGLVPKNSAKKKGDRESWKSDELTTLFSTEIHTQGKHKHNYYYWLPLMALYSGARLEELCQLYTSDIKQLEDIWCFSISDKGDDQKLKNQASRRIVPIHQHLIDLGFLKFLEDCKKTGKQRIFQELELGGDDQYGQYAGRWFSRFKKAQGFNTSKKVFHSFRHTMVDALRKLRAHNYELTAIVGHSTGSVTHEVYGDDVLNVNEVLQKVDYRTELSNVKPWKQ